MAQTFDGDEMLKAITELIKVDKDWVPEGDGYSLYIRPTGISTEVRAAVPYAQPDLGWRRGWLTRVACDVPATASGDAGRGPVSVG